MKFNVDGTCSHYVIYIYMLLCCLLSIGHALRHLFEVNYVAIHDAKHKKLTVNANFRV